MNAPGVHQSAEYRLSDMAEAVDGRLHGADRAFAGVSIDTRTLPANALFFALRGEHTDGHAYVDKAASLGAAGAVVDRVTDSRVPQIEVADTTAALQRAGAAWRQAFPGTVVGITGSNGKTSVKEMLASILREQAPTLATQGNLNNHLGVPLTLLRLTAGFETAVIEMGASHGGEIAMLCELARPKIGLVTNAGLAHLEGFGSREAVAAAKGELYAHLPDDGIAIINADDAFSEQWSARAAHCQRLYFAYDDAAAEIHARDVVFDDAGGRFTLVTPAGSCAVELALPGEHSIRNALAAAAAAAALGVPVKTIAAGLAGVSAVGGRLAARPAQGARLIDDSYNANPASLDAALAWLARQEGPRWLVLGDMAELGAAADDAHRRAGEQARQAGVERLWATGDKSRIAVEAFGNGGEWFADHHELNAALLQALDAAQALPFVLVKGSRSARMDRVVDALTADCATAAGATTPAAGAGASCSGASC